MRIRMRLAGAVAGTTIAGLSAFTMATAVPAGAQPTRPAVQTVTTAPQHPAIAKDWDCWDGDCWGDWDGGWDGGWYGWHHGWWGW